MALLSRVNTLVMLIISSLSCHGWMTKEGGSFSCRGIKGRRMDEPARGVVDGCFQPKGPFCLSFIERCCKSSVERCIDKQMLPLLFYYSYLGPRTCQKANYLSSLIFSGQINERPVSKNVSY